MAAESTINPKMVQTINGVKYIQVQNPLPVAYAGLNTPAGTVLVGENGQPLPKGPVALSISPNGVVQGRPLNPGWTPGSWEAIVAQVGTTASIHPDDNSAFSFVVN